ncbi:MAG TPA: hypothetical protein VMU69_13965 [Bradyrhizobium sp.]|nr:hypothetical protein [Bradyrhizobium sp.]
MISALFEHDLRANAFRVCREGKPVSTFPDHALGSFPTVSDMPVGMIIVFPARIAIAIAKKFNLAVQSAQPIKLQGHLLKLRRNRREFGGPAADLAQLQFDIRISIYAHDVTPQGI